MNDTDLKKILLEGGYITEENAAIAERYTKANQTSLYDALIDLDLLNKTVFGEAIAESYNVPFVDLIPNAPVKSIVLSLPEDIAKKYHVVLWNKGDEKTYSFATDNPDQKGLREDLAKAFPDQEIAVYYGLPKDVTMIFAHYRFPIKTRLDSIAASGEDVASRLLKEIYEEALVYNASDIHIEPQKADVRIRFRIDGVLQEVTRIARDLHTAVINLIKVDADLRIDEHASSQDGAIRYENNGTATDFRVSILPTLPGEKVVMRILSTYSQTLALRELGLSSGDEMLIRASIKRPYGMVLVTGPTGSGKTTTLYSIIKVLNTPNVNITTIEDPVEYEVNGINQVQVNPHGNLTFDKGLRSIVRQDPNIILVGEIRDLETANVAVNAALTGHLLLSTFHANDAASTIPRLIDLGIPPFMIASTLELIATQRLVRLICPGCRQSVTLTKAQIDEIAPGASRYFDADPVILYVGKKCEVCSWTGYFSRHAIFEVIKVTPELQDMILTSPSAKQLRELSRSQGFLSLFENGLLLVKQGQTTLEELARVTATPDAPVGEENTKNYAARNSQKTKK
ncbi:MAG: GspE/PulE family protein [Patescibacteria group bacterium]